MERSYLTAEVFREILQQNGRSNENGELIRTLSGRQVDPFSLASPWHWTQWPKCLEGSSALLTLMCNCQELWMRFLSSLAVLPLASLPVLTPEGLALQVSDVNADDRSSPTDKHTQKIAAHVSAYIHHVRTQLKQTIPKAIVHCLVSRLVLCVSLC